jgi:hypothetical protein
MQRDSITSNASTLQHTSLETNPSQVDVRGAFCDALQQVQVVFTRRMKAS